MATPPPAWRTAPVLSVGGLSVGAGIAAFGVTAVIGDVAAAFGAPSADPGIAQIGLPVTTVGIALAIMRVASLGSLPLAALADRIGRRRVLLGVATVGLALTTLAAAAPGFWWYVALVALARPGLATINATAAVVAAEEARAQGRAAAIALVTAAYGIGSGIVSIGRGLLPGEPSFRVVTAFAAVPLLLLPLLARHMREPAIAVERAHATGLPGTLPRGVRGRVAVLAFLVGAIALATGPGFTYLFVYGERVLGASPLEIAVLVVAAGPAGLAGILLGRWGADVLGRRITGAVTMAGTGLAVAIAYSGGLPALAAGYLGTILFAGAFAPTQGAFVAELVPTAYRGATAGWVAVSGVVGAAVGLTLFGVLADATGGFGAARLLGVVVALGAAGFAALPETRGTELEQLEPDHMAE